MLENINLSYIAQDHSSVTILNYLMNKHTLSQLPTMCQRCDKGRVYLCKWRQISKSHRDLYLALYNAQCRTGPSYFHMLK